MATRSSHNKNNSAVKRILQEAKELQNDPSHEYSAGPLENDIFEWHATLRGAPDTEFEGGLYHCRILLPSEYPFRPPSIMVLTPNGRFELNKKICISFTSYHEELWQPAWGVRTAIIGLQGFFPHKGESAVGVGALEYPIAERKRLAALSREWHCPDCQQTNLESLPDPPAQ
ncbi:UBC-like protein, partial [Ceratobasidium sp. AG-I]